MVGTRLKGSVSLSCIVESDLNGPFYKISAGPGCKYLHGVDGMLDPLETENNLCATPFCIASQVILYVLNATTTSKRYITWSEKAVDHIVFQDSPRSTLTQRKQSFKQHR